jgi:uncharacterized membrane protein
MQQNPWQNQPPYGPPPGPVGPPFPGGPVEAMSTPAPSQAISVIDSVRFIFTDDDWKNKLLIASVFMFIPIIGPISLQGWHAEMMQRLVRRHPKPIPRLDFSDLMHYFGRGVAGFVISLVLMLPFFLVTYFGFVISMLGGAALAAATDEPVLMVVAWVLVGFLYIFGMLTMITVMHAAMTRAELTENIGDAISPSKIFALLRKTWLKTLLNGVLYALVAIPIVILGYAMCIFGLYPAIIIIGCGTVFLRYQLYRYYLAEGGEPIAIKPVEVIPSEARSYAAQYAPQGQYGRYQGQQPPSYYR